MPDAPAATLATIPVFELRSLELLTQMLRWLSGRLLYWSQRSEGLSPDSDLLSKGGPDWHVKMLRWLVYLSCAPFLVWTACEFLPETWVVALAQISDQWLWSFLKTTHIHNCKSHCREIAFGLIAAPVSTVLGIIAGVRWYLCGPQLIAYHESLRRRGALWNRLGLSARDMVLFLRRAPIVLIILLIGLALVFFTGFLPIGEASHASLAESLR
jgi:hypothetical protein